MRSLRLAPMWLLIGYALVAVVLVSSLVPIAPDTSRPNDKLMHLVAYCILALWFGAIYQQDRFARLGLYLVALGGVIECLQAGTSYRSFEMTDLLADAVGTVAGLLLAITPLGGMLLMLEKHLPRHD